MAPSSPSWLDWLDPVLGTVIVIALLGVTMAILVWRRLTRSERRVERYAEPGLRRARTEAGTYAGAANMGGTGDIGGSATGSKARSKDDLNAGTHWEKGIDDGGAGDGGGDSGGGGDGGGGD